MAFVGMLFVMIAAVGAVIAISTALIVVGIILKKNTKYIQTGTVLEAFGIVIMIPLILFAAIYLYWRIAVIG